MVIRMTMIVKIIWTVYVKLFSGPSTLHSGTAQGTIGGSGTLAWTGSNTCCVLCVCACVCVCLCVCFCSFSPDMVTSTLLLRGERKLQAKWTCQGNCQLMASADTQHQQHNFVYDYKVSGFVLESRLHFNMWLRSSVKWKTHSKVVPRNQSAA